MDLVAAIAVAVVIHVPVSSWKAALKKKGLKTKGRSLQLINPNSKHLSLSMTMTIIKTFSVSCISGTLFLFTFLP